MAIPIKDFVYEWLKNDSSADLLVAGTLQSPVVFKWTVPDNRSFILHRFNVILTATAMQYGKYGSLDALANGTLLAAYDNNNNMIKDFTGGIPIKANEDWGGLAGVDSIVHPAAGPDSNPVRFTVDRAAGGIGAEMKAGYYVATSIRDALNVGLLKHRLMVQGWLL